MKSLHKVVLFCIMALGGSFGYYYFESRWMTGRIDDNTEAIEVQGGKIETLEGRVGENETAIDFQGKEISANREDLTSQSDHIKKTQDRMAILNSRIAEMEKGAAEDRDLLARMRKDLEVLKDDFDRRMADSEKQLESALERDEEQDARLRAIEKSLGIERPEP
jgi:uncharacterized coiled-coil protein SlyX